jgi:hypothetical protein
MITLYPLKYNKYKNYYTNINFTVDETNLSLNISGLFANKYINNSIQLDKSLLVTSTTVLNNSITAKFSYLVVDLYSYTYDSNTISFNSIEPHKPEFLLYLNADNNKCINDFVSLIVSNSNIGFSSASTQYSETSNYSLTSALSYTSLLSLTSNTAIISLTSNKSLTSNISLTSLYSLTTNLSYTALQSQYSDTSNYSLTSDLSYTSLYSLTSINSLTAITLNGYIASQTSNPNSIPVSDSNGKLDINWLQASQTPQANQIPVLDNNANLILPSTSLIQTNTYTIRRVDLTNATDDYMLAVGEEAIINFKDTKSVPLHIATQDGTVYEMHLIPSNTGGTSGGVKAEIYLNPNNTTYSNAFYYAELYRHSSDGSSNYYNYSAFRIGWAYTSLYCIITNRTVYKNIKGFEDIYGVDYSYPDLGIIATDWRDTTTSWTSLGTITFPQKRSGQILVRRLV